jgi:hypothetical protein
VGIVRCWETRLPCSDKDAIWKAGPRSTSRHPVTTLAFGRQSFLGTCRLVGLNKATSASFCLQSRVIQVEVPGQQTHGFYL